MRGGLLTCAIALTLSTACGRWAYDDISSDDPDPPPPGAPDATPVDSTQPVSTAAVQITSTNPDSCHPQVVYTGSQRFVVWVEKPSNDVVYMMEIDADGNPVGGRDAIGSDGSAPRDLVAIWTGQEIAVLWAASQRIRYSLALPDATVVVDSQDVATNQGNTSRMDVTSHSDSLAIVFRRGPSDSGTVRSLLIDETANVVAGPDDLSSSSADIDAPEISFGATTYTVLWEQGDAIMSRTLAQNGMPGAAAQTIYSPVRPVFSAAWADDRHGVVFAADPTTTGDIRIALLNESGQMMTPGEPPIIAEDTQQAREPAVAWSGEYFGVVFIRGGLQFALVNVDGRQVGDAIPIPGSDFAEVPDVTWAGDRFLVTWQGYDSNNDYQLYGAAVTLQ